MSLKTSYRIIAPFYDIFIERFTAEARHRSLRYLPQTGHTRVLLCGSGTGLDFQYLPPCHHYVALDLTPAMLRRSRQQMQNLQLNLMQGDSMCLPFADESVDYVVLHLILAVVPDPKRCLSEISRVLKPQGSVLIFDKFLKPGELAWFRRTFSPVSSRIATKLDVVFEDVLTNVPRLKMVRNEPALVRGWFRLIGLQKI